MILYLSKCIEKNWIKKIFWFESFPWLLNWNLYQMIIKIGVYFYGILYDEKVENCILESII